jgi:hypothetical protein
MDASKPKPSSIGTFFQMFHPHSFIHRSFIQKSAGVIAHFAKIAGYGVLTTSSLSPALWEERIAAIVAFGHGGPDTAGVSQS